MNQLGDIVKRPKLAVTLRRLANHPNPIELFYKGDIASTLVNDIKKHKGIVTKEDFANYRFVDQFYLQFILLN